MKTNWTRGKEKLLRVIPWILLIVIVLVNDSVSANDSNENIIDGPDYGSWKTRGTYDSFYGTMISQSATQFIGEGAVHYYCINSNLRMSFFPNFKDVARMVANPGSINSDHVDVFIRVDDKPIMEIVGTSYPITSVINSDDLRKIIELFRTGSIARVRTIHAEGKNTFIIGLEGFTGASVWVEAGCR